jgi:hypothetical protein
VNSMIQLTDGRLVSGSDDNTIKILDTISGSFDGSRGTF